MAEDEIGRGALLAAVARHCGNELPQGLQPRVHLVGDVLRIKKPEAVAVDVARELEERVHLVVLAAEAEDQDAARVGMAQ